MSDAPEYLTSQERAVLVPGLRPGQLRGFSSILRCDYTTTGWKRQRAVLYRLQLNVVGAAVYGESLFSIASLPAMVQSTTGSSTGNHCYRSCLPLASRVKLLEARDEKRTACSKAGWTADSSGKILPPADEEYSA